MIWSQEVSNTVANSTVMTGGCLKELHISMENSTLMNVMEVPGQEHNLTLFPLKLLCFMHFSQMLNLTINSELVKPPGVADGCQ